MLTALLVPLLLAATPAPQPIAPSEAFPTAGRPTTLTLAADFERVDAVYQPNSAVPERQHIITSASGRSVEWTPHRGGVVQLEAYNNADDPEPAATKVLSVAFDGVPTGGLIIAILAALILFGGAAVSLRRILSND